MSNPGYHAALKGQTFKLGGITYLIGRTQAKPDLVRCYRAEAGESTIVELPLVFVLEQFAEEVELEAI